MADALDAGDLDAWRKEIDRADERLEPWIRRTPLLWSRALSAIADCPVYLKPENLQVSGSFKVRPALNGMLHAIDDARKFGVVCSSSGNFGAAAAWGARALDVRVTIVVAPTTAGFKMDMMRRFGAEIVYCEPDYASRQKTVDRLKAERGLIEIHPHSSVATIAGDGTAGREIMDALPHTGTIIVPTSGGGFVAGVALAAKDRRADVSVVAVQSSGNPAMAMSFRKRERVTIADGKTIADGLVATSPGERPFGIVRRYVDDVLLVDDQEMIEAVRFLWNEERLAVEPSGAATVATLLKGQCRGRKGPIVLVLSGANIDPERWLGFYRAPGTAASP